VIEPGRGRSLDATPSPPDSGCAGSDILRVMYGV
jgi:hypothetical protein